jgi:hypothetical protein
MKPTQLLALLLAGCGKGSTGSDAGSSCTSFGGVCLYAPTQPAARTACGEVAEFCDATATPAPNLGCLTSAPPMRPDKPATLTLTGFVHVFSSGPDSRNLSVAVYDAALLAGGADPSTVTPMATTVVMLDPTMMRACDADARYGCSIPSATGCTLPVCNDGLNGRPNDRKYCRVVSGGAGGTECSDRLRWEARYSFDNIPTNKQLVLRTTGPGGAADNLWATLYTWNVFLGTGDRKCASIEDNECLSATDPKYQLNVSALSQSDYVAIPQASGLSSGISPGRAAVAGEVHDCDNVRVANVAVGLLPLPDRFTFFNGDPIKTLPDSGRAYGTDRLGLYAAFNTKPGKLTVQAAGITVAGGELTSFGAFEAYAYPDTVAVVNINGGRPAK